MMCLTALNLYDKFKSTYRVNSRLILFVFYIAGLKLINEKVWNIGRYIMNNEITVKRAVLHVLDINSGIPVLSRGELEITGELSDYLGSHIDKMLEDSNLKNAVFTGEDSSILRLCKLLNDTEDDFLSITADAANKLFLLMQKNIDIPSADLVCCLLEINGAKHLGVIKLNYKAGFTHWVHNANGGSVNTIIRHKTLLPQEGQRLEECALIDLSNFGIKLLEKQYEINGVNEFYLAKYYLQCSCQLSDNAKLKILDKVTKSINKKYFDEDFEKAIKVKKAVTESFEETSSIQIDRIADQVFEKDVAIRREYVDEIEKAGLNEKEITIPDRLIEKKFKTHKIKTDTGIEIDFPLEYAGNRDKIEFVNNSDGTISIIIRNIGRITNR